MAEDLPLPDGPTMPISRVPGRRAIMSATSRSRPKNTGASSTSNDARPLNGHAGRASEPASCARSRTVWSSTTSVATSSPARCQPARSADARAAASPTRRVATARAHAAAARCTRAGTPPLSASEAVHRRLDRGPRAGVIARQRGDVVAPERRQRQRLALALDGRRDGQDGPVRRDLGRLRDVVEDEQRRPVHLFQLAVGDRAAVAAHLLGELLHEPRLADARRSRDEHARARAGASPAPETAQVRKLGVAPDQRGAGRLLPRRVERRVLAQDRLVQPPQLGAGLDADLLDQRRARLAVRLQRLGLAARAVEREHALRVQALAQRLLRQQRLELRQHLAVAPGVEVLVDRDLERTRAQLLQAPDLRSGERLVGDVRQRRPAPQAQRLARGALGEQSLEARRRPPGRGRAAADSRARASRSRRRSPCAAIALRSCET